MLQPAGFANRLFLKANHFFSRHVFSYLASCAVILPLLVGANCANAYDASTAQNWLVDQQVDNGAFGSGPDTSVTARASYFAAQSLELTGGAYNRPAAIDYIASNSVGNLEARAQQILIGATVTGDAPNLLSFQTLSGGFSDYPGFDTTAFDSTWAVAALSAMGNQGALSTSVGYLLGRQGSSGAWSDFSGRPSVWTTARAISSLVPLRAQYTNVSTAVTEGAGYLLSLVDADGLISGDTISSAAALLALTDAGADKAKLSATANALKNLQLANGSWGNDVLTTALALSAVWAYDAQSNGGVAVMIKGRVLKAGSTEPIAGVSVVVSNSGVEVATDANGTFVINSNIAGNVSLAFSKSGLMPVSLGVAVTSATVDVGDVVMSGDAARAILQGHIFDDRSKQDIAGAKVTLSGAISYSANADNFGAIYLPGIEPGQYTITIQASTYRDLSGSITLAAGQNAYINQGLISVSTPLVSTPVPLVGRIVDGESGAPISGAAISLDSSATTSTDGAGGFLFAEVARGSHALTVSSNGYQTIAVGIDIPAGATGALGDVRIYRTTDQQSPSTLTITALITNALNGAPIANASVMVGDVSGTTSTSGLVTLTNLSNLSNSVSVAAANYQSVSGTLTASGFGSLNTTISLTPQTDPATSVGLTGNITDTQGNPVAGAVVTIPDANLSATTDSAGYYSLSGIASLSFDLSVSANGYLGVSRAVTVQSYGNYATDFQLEAVTDRGWQILSIVSDAASVGANADVQVDAIVKNLVAAPGRVVITGQVLDQQGAWVADLVPFDPASGALQSVFDFDANAINTIAFHWNSGVVAAASYQIRVRVVQEGTISRNLPSGIVLAESRGSIMLESDAVFSGGLSFTPPMSQAGTKTPIALQVLTRNAGNMPLAASGYQLVIKSDQGATLYSTSAQGSALEINEVGNLDFGTWVPSQAGHLQVTVTSSNSSVNGDIQQIYYVGDVAVGTFTLDQTVFPEGNAQTRGHISLKGVDTTTGTATDPLFKQVRTATNKAGAWIGPAAMTWYNNNAKECMGCHIQTQSLYGLSAASNKSDIDPVWAKQLYNLIAGSQQNDGSMRMSHSDFGKTQSSLGSWSLVTWPDAQQAFRTKYQGLQYLWGRRVDSAGQVYWNRDHDTGWQSIDPDGITAINTQTIADLLINKKNGLDQNQLDYSIGTAFSLSGNGSDPRAIAVQNDALLIAKRGIIQRYTPSTKTSESIYADSQSRTFYDLLVSASGDTYALGSGFILRIPASGGTAQTITANVTADSSMVEWNGDIYATNPSGNQILRLTTSNNQIQVFAQAGQLSNPRGIAVNNDGRLLVANFNGRNIIAYSANAASTTWLEPIPFPPLRLRTSPSGQVYIISRWYSDSGLVTPNGVTRVNTDGTLERLVGHTSTDESLRDIAWLGEQLYFVDRGANALHPIAAGALDTSLLGQVESSLPKLAEFYLSRASNTESETLRYAFRLIGLGELKRVVQDQALLERINAAMPILGDRLRQRQNTNGGWGRYAGNASDPLVTAWVGLALDYTNPSKDDPVIRKIVQHLLSTQQGPGYWHPLNFFSTNLGTTSLVMSYLPKALERLGGLDVGLQLTTPTTIQLSNPSVAPTTVSSTSDGSALYRWNLVGVTQTGQVIDFDLQAPNLMLGENRPVASAAQLSFRNSFNNETITTDLAIPSVKALTQLALHVVTDKTTYSAFEPVNAVVTLANGGIDFAGGTLDLEIRAAGSPEAFSNLGSIAGVSIGAGIETSYPTQWNTGANLASDYVVYARLRDSQGRVQVEGVAPFTIGSTAGSATGSAGSGGSQDYFASIRTDRAIYKNWDSVLLTSRAANNTFNTITNPALAVVKVIASNGMTVYLNEYSVDGLVPVALSERQHQMALANAATGNYSASIELWNADRTALLANASAQFSVVASASSGLIGAVESSAPWVYQGDTLTCTDRLTNRSDTMQSVAAHYVLVRTDDQTVISDSSANVALAVNGVDVHGRGIDTQTLPLGSYACVLSVGDVTPKTLAYAGFEIKEPPVKLTGTLQKGTRGRLLALLDAPQQCVPLKSIAADFRFTGSLLGYADNTINLTVYDANGSLVDQESVTTGNQANVNVMATDVSVKFASDGTLSVSLSGSLLDDSYTIRADRKSLLGTETKQWKLASDCHRSLVLNQWIGDQRLLSYQTVTSNEPTDSADPHGPSGPSLKTQRSAFENLLAKRGWNYTIVENAADFDREMHKGTYSVYALLAEDVYLSIWTQKALREAVNAGAGLMTTGAYDIRHIGLQPALGVLPLGLHTKANGLRIDDTQLGGPWTGSLPLADRNYAVLPRGATVLGEFDIASHNDHGFFSWFDDKEFDSWRVSLHDAADESGSNGYDQQWLSWFDHDVCRCLDRDQDGYSGWYWLNHGQWNPLSWWGGSYCSTVNWPALKKPAITLNNYGRGRALFAGFDWVLQAAQAGADTVYASSLMAALDRLNPTVFDVVPGASTPVDLTVINQAIATPGRVLLSMTNTSLVDASSFGAGNPAQWSFQIAAQQQLTQHLQLAVPGSGDATLSAQVQSGQEGAWRDQITLNMTLAPTRTLATVDSALTLAQQLKSEYIYDLRYWSVVTKLQFAKSCLADGHPTWAYHALLMATNVLLLDTRPEAIQLRLALDDLVREAAKKLTY